MDLAKANVSCVAPLSRIKMNPLQDEDVANTHYPHGGIMPAFLFGALLTLSLLLIPSQSFAGGHLTPVHCISAGVMTGTAALTSSPIDIQGTPLVSVSLVFTGTPNGSFAIQASDDYGSATNPAGTWTDIGAGITDATGSAGDRLINIADVGYSYIRVVYTNTSSTGVLDAFVTGKGY